MSDVAFPQLDKMRMGVDHTFSVALRDFTVRLRPLSVDEHCQIVARIAEALETRPKFYQGQLNQETLLAKAILQDASSPFGQNSPHLTAALLGRCNEAELHHLLKEYTSGCDACDPRLETLPKANLDALVDQVKKNAVEAKSSDDKHFLRSKLIELSFLDLVSLSMELLRQSESPTAS